MSITKFSPPNLLNRYSIQEIQVNNLPTCVLHWRQRKLLIHKSKDISSLCVPSLQNKQWLVACLRHTPIELVLIASALEWEQVESWAEACQQTGKPIFLRTFSNPQLRRQQSKLSWHLKRSLDFIIAVLQATILSPLLLPIVLIQMNYPDSLLDQNWYIGNRGKLIRVFKFRSDTACGWLRQFNFLDDLLKLFNVLRGEMSFVGSYPLQLQDIASLDLTQQWQLKALPGITGIWNTRENSSLIDRVTRINHNADYILHWSFQRDCEILLNSISKIFCNEQD